MLADEARRRRHGAETTYVRVADVALPLGGALDIPPAAREVRVSADAAALASAAAVAPRRGRGVGDSAGVGLLAGGPAGARASVRDAARWTSCVTPACRRHVHRRGAHRRARRGGVRARSRARGRARPGATHGPPAGGAGGSTRAAPAGRRAAARARLAAELRAAAAVTGQPASPTTGYEDVRADRPGAPAGRQHPVHPGGLVALRPEARAGGADGRRRRSGRRVGPDDESEGRRRATARRDAAEHPGRRAACRWSATAHTGGSADEPAPPRRGRVPQRASARLRPASAMPIGSTCGSTFRHAAPSCFTRARSTSAWCRRSSTCAASRTSRVPGVAIGSDGPVASVAVFSRVPIDRVRTVALDASSRTSVALFTVLCARHFGIEPGGARDAARIRGDARDRATRRSSSATSRCCSITPRPACRRRTSAWRGGRTRGCRSSTPSGSAGPGLLAAGDVAALREACRLGVEHCDEVARAALPGRPGPRGRRRPVPS